MEVEVQEYLDQFMKMAEAANENDGYIRAYSSWGWLLVITGVLIGLNLALGFFDNLIAALKIRRSLRTRLQRVLRIFRITFEPIAIAIWITTLVLINPIIHGSLMLVATVVIFNHIRNYLAGRLFLLENSIREGGSIMVRGKKGEIVRMGRLGIKVRLEEGLQHITYRELAEKGYMLASGSETGMFYKLRIQKQESSNGKHALIDLKDLLATSPYVDWSYEPEIAPVPEQAEHWTARLQLRKDTHLPELVELLAESGYQCSMPLQN